MSKKLSLPIPKNWTVAKLEDLVIKFIGGGTPSKANPVYYQGDIPWMTVKDMTSRRPQKITDSITLEAITNSATNLIPPDTIIIATRMSLGKIARLTFEVAINQDLKALILSQDIEKDFIEYWYVSEAANIQSLGTGTTVKGIRLEVLQELKVPLPPLNEQRRIVAKIESLRARSQRVKDALEDIPQLLDQFRQSVLAAAFRGDLTADWREQNNNVEPASVLLERIRAERRRCWEEAELEKMKASGKLPKDDKWKDKYIEPEAVNDAQLPELPYGWAWIPVELISTKVVDGVHKKPDYKTEGIPFVTVKNLTAGPSISFDELNYVSLDDHKEFFKRANPEKGDILISKDGTLGIVRVVRTERIFSIFVSVALVKPVNYELSDYLELAFSSPQMQKQMLGTGTGLMHIHLKDLRRYAVPIAPLDEQKEIVKRINNHLMALDNIKLTLENIVKSHNQLDQSILAKAFRGELVPQDPNDEPASILLERIRAERTKLETKTAKKSAAKTSSRSTKKAQAQAEESVQLEIRLE